jgi:hypothetical protein
MGQFGGASTRLELLIASHSDPARMVRSLTPLTRCVCHLHKKHTIMLATLVPVISKAGFQRNIA